MKKRHLGKLLTLVCFPYLVWAGSVKATIDNPLIMKGDSAVLTIVAEGDSIRFPRLDEIVGFPILGTAQSQSITSINGKSSKKLSQSYTFRPLKSVQIPSFDVEVDGETLFTKPLTLEVSKPKAASKDAPVQLEMKLAKTDVYVGEPVRLDLIFKKSPNATFSKIELAEPELTSFWAKKLPESAPRSENGYIEQTYSYLLFPQQAGDFTIPATFAKLEHVQKNRRRSSMFNDPFFNDPFFSTFGASQVSWKKIFSNDAVLHVKSLPDKLEIFGTFDIKATADKKQVAANKPINLTITLEGVGNLDDIKKFELDIPDAVVYADEPIIQASVNNGTYRGVFSQKVAIVADRNYTIPPISFTYFDKETKASKTIQTNPIHIKVTGATKATAPTVIEKAPAQTKNSMLETTSIKSVVKEEGSYEKYFYLLSGIVFGSMLSYFVLGAKGRKRVKKEHSIIKKIEKSKDDKTLFELLLPYAHEDKIIKRELEKLENNLYQNGNEEIDKEGILSYFDELEKTL